MPNDPNGASQRRLRAVPEADTSPVVTDEELLVRVGRGDRAAFEALYDRHAGAVLGVARNVVRDPSQAEEVAQEVLVEIWRTAVRFDPERGKARTWMLTIAHRRAVDRVRSEQAHRDRTDRVGHRDRDRDHDVVAETVTTRFEHRQVREALDTLTDLQREAVELAYYKGLTYREVAELLDAPLGTVKTRMRDGMIRLRDALGVAQ